MKKGKKIFNHPFLNRYTVLGAILLTVYALAAAEGVFGAVFGGLFAALGGMELYPLGVVPGALLVLAIHKRWFYPEFEGNLRGGRPALGFKLGLLIVISWAMLPVGLLRHPENYGPPTLANLILALMAGFGEGTAFRGLPLSYLMRQWKDEQKLPVALLLSSVLFSLVHLSNLLGGASISLTLVQLLSSLCMGFFFGAVYLRSGNLWPTIVYHTLHDVVAFLDVSTVSEGIMARAFQFSDLPDLLLSVVLGVVGYWLIRPAKRGEILALWREKWQPLPEPAAEAEAGQST